MIRTVANRNIPDRIRGKIRFRGTLYAFLGFPAALIGIALCAAAGMQDDLHNISIPGAQVGVLLVFGGFLLIGRALYLDWLSRH